MAARLVVDATCEDVAAPLTGTGERQRTARRLAVANTASAPTPGTCAPSLTPHEMLLVDAIAERVAALLTVTPALGRVVDTAIAYVLSVRVLGKHEPLIADLT